MAQRLRPLVAVGGRLRRKLEVQLPPEPDDAARRDGIDDAHRPPDRGIGERAWHLAQIVAATPLSLWRELGGADPAATLGLVRANDHREALQHGWSVAARRQRDPRWAEALIRETGDPELLDVLAPGAGDEVAIELLGKASHMHAQLDLLERMPGPWSPALSRAALEHLGRSMAAAEHLWNVRLGTIAQRLDLDARDAAAAALAPVFERELPPAVRARLHELLAILDLRHAMTRELQR
jgi:hypothetical protein